MDANSANLGRALAYALIVPVCLWLGLMLSTPTSAVSLVGVGVVLLALALPLLLRWHSVLLIGFWNAAIVVPFLPGQPPAWVPLAGLSLAIAVVNRTLRHRAQFIWVPSVAIPLLLLGLVIMVTVMIRGIGARAFGSELWGAKRYLWVFGAVLGYFALTAARVPQRQAGWAAGLFFISGTTALMSDVALAGGRAFYWLFMFFPTDVAFHQAMSADTMKRFTGMAWMAQAGSWFMLLRYGIRGILDPFRPWRLLLFIGLFLLGLFGGFRSSIILLVLLSVAQFWFERLVFTRILPLVLLGAVLGGALLAGFAERLPLSVQRSLSFLPINVHPAARQDAQGTLDWRLQMWRVVLPDVPQYLWLGKGYTFSGTDFLLVQESIRRGMFTAYEDTLVSGNYHNGPLTLLIPFGLPGTVAFAAFLWGAWRVLLRNYRHGPPELGRVNTFLIAYFSARLLFFLVFYGQFDLDLMVFTGTVGLSLALNGGVCPARPPTPAAPAA